MASKSTRPKRLRRFRHGGWFLLMSPSKLRARVKVVAVFRDLHGSRYIVGLVDTRGGARNGD